MGSTISVLVSNLIEFFATDLTKVACGIRMIAYKTLIVQSKPHQALNFQAWNLKSVK